MSNVKHPTAVSSSKSGWHIFRPILPGATAGDRALACLAAMIGIALSGFICSVAFGAGPHLVLLVPPMGASAVLVFAVPASPLAQPWPTIGGNVLSALVGILVAQVIPQPALAAGVAVGLAIGVMSICRCLHPPGGAAALVGVFGGPAVASAGLLFPLIPVGANAIILVAVGMLFHKLSRRPYPHVAAPPPKPVHGTNDVPPLARSGPSTEDVDAAIADVGEALDISRADLDLLLSRIEIRAQERQSRGLSCGAIMSRDVVWVDETTPIAEARKLLLDRGLHIAPVLDQDRRVLGTIGLAEIDNGDGHAADVMSPAVEARPDDLAVTVARLLAEGGAHAVVVVDEDHQLLGLLTQTDMLALMSHAENRPRSAK